MRFLHLADVHLGADPHSGKLKDVNRKEEIWDTFRSTMGTAQKLGVELVLIAGDLFHYQPSMRDMKEVDYILSKIYRGKVVIIAGNHDYLRTDGGYSVFDWNENITVLDKPSEDKPIDKVFFPEWNLEVYGFSYDRKEIKEPLYDNLKPEDNGRIHILLAHGGDENHIPISREFMAGGAFDYLALGHIHKPGMMSNGGAAFAGSLEPTDCNDLGKRGCIICDIEQKNGKIEIHPGFVSMARRVYIRETIEVTRNMTNGSLMDLLDSRINDLGKENIYRWTLTGYRDKDIVFNTERIKTLGNVLEVIDETRPYYNINELLNGHSNDIVGMYILSFLTGEDGRVKKPEELNELEIEALDVGIQAMLG